MTGRSWRTFLGVCSMYLKSFYNLPSRKARGEGRAAAKDILKGIGIAALVLLVLGDVLVLFVGMNLIMYQGLAPLGLQGALFVYAAVSATVLTFVVGFMTILSTYFLSDMELNLLSMPIPPFTLLGAKFITVYVSEAAISLAFMGSAIGIYGWFERPDFLFYAWGFLASLLLPLPAMALCYLIQVPLLSFAKFLKNKQVILIFGGVVGLAAAVGFNLYYQGMMVGISDPAWIVRNIAGPDTVVNRMASIYPPAQLVLRALTGSSSLGGFFAILVLLVSCVAGSALVVLALAKPYARSLPGFNELHLKKLGKAGSASFLRSSSRRGSLFAALVKREIVLMNREPMYLLNGPFIVVLMPLIMILMLMTQKETFLSDPDIAGVLEMLRGGMASVVIGLAGAFLGSSTSITCTALSRDAKSLAFIRSLPIPAGSYMLAKLAHGLLFAVFGSLTGVLLPALAMKLGVLETLVGLLIALGLSFLGNLLGLALETINPRLSWDNPIAALKQNPNAVIVILGEMGLIGLCGTAAFSLRFSLFSSALWLGALPLALFAALLFYYPKFAERRLAKLEP